MPAPADGRLLFELTRMRSDIPADCASKDLSARAGGFLAIWGAPVAIATALSLAPVAGWLSAFAWTIAFTWMGGACLLNARRCGRLHCYFSGPILLLGAVMAAVVGFGVVTFGAHGMTTVVMATLVLAALTYLLEYIWGRYRPANTGDR
ncbi:MAG: hypothetical protein AB7G40_12340 [Hyphomonadaceae bacterium]